MPFQPLQMLALQVFRTIDDAQIFTSPAFYGGLQQTSVLFGDIGFGLYDHAFPAFACQGQPPVHTFRPAGLILGIDADIFDFYLLFRRLV